MDLSALLEFWPVDLEVRILACLGCRQFMAYLIIAARNGTVVEALERMTSLVVGVVCAAAPGLDIWNRADCAKYEDPMSNIT